MKVDTALFVCSPLFRSVAWRKNILFQSADGKFLFQSVEVFSVAYGMVMLGAAVCVRAIPGVWASLYIPIPRFWEFQRSGDANCRDRRGGLGGRKGGLRMRTMMRRHERNG